MSLSNNRAHRDCWFQKRGFLALAKLGATSFLFVFGDLHAETARREKLAVNSDKESFLFRTTASLFSQRQGGQRFNHMTTQPELHVKSLYHHHTQKLKHTHGCVPNTPYVYTLQSLVVVVQLFPKRVTSLFVLTWSYNWLGSKVLTWSFSVYCVWETQCQLVTTNGRRFFRTQRGRSFMREKADKSHAGPFIRGGGAEYKTSNDCTDSFGRTERGVAKKLYNRRWWWWIMSYISNSAYMCVWLCVWFFLHLPCLAATAAERPQVLVCPLHNWWTNKWTNNVDQILESHCACLGPNGWRQWRNHEI